MGFRFRFGMIVVTDTNRLGELLENRIKTNST